MLGGLLAESLKQGMLPEQMECAKRREFLLKLTEDPLTLPALEGKNGEAGKQALEKTVYRITAASRTHWVDVPFIYEETEESPVTAAVTAESEEVLPLLLKRLREETSPYDWKNGRGSDGCPQECTGGLRIRLIGLCLWHGWEEEAEEYAAFVEQELVRQRASGKSRICHVCTAASGSWRDAGDGLSYESSGKKREGLYSPCF